MSAEALKLFPAVLQAVANSTALTVTFQAQVRCGWMGVEGLMVGLETGEVALITEKGAEVLVLGKHAKAVWCMCGYKIFAATGSIDGSIILWNTHTRKQVCALPGHFDWVRCLYFDPSTSFLYSGSDDFTIKVWDCTTFAEIHTLKGHQSEISCLIMARDGLISGSNDGTVRVWCTENWTELAVLKAHTREIPCIVVSPNKKYLLTASHDTTISVWQLPAVSQQALLTIHKDVIWCLAISSDSTFFLSGSTDKTIRLFSLETLTEMACLKGHTMEINAIVITSTDKFAISSSSDFTIKVWDLVTRTEVVTLTGHTDLVYSVFMSADETNIYSYSRDRTVKVWSFDNLQDSREVLRHDGAITCLATSSGKYMASADTDATIKVWDWEKMVEVGKMKGHSKGITCLELSQDGTLIVTGSDDCTVRLWSIEDMQEKHTFEGHSERITCLSLSADSTFAVSGSRDQSLRMWHMDTLTSSRPCTGQQDSILCLSLVPNRLEVFSGSIDGSICLWNLETLVMTSTYFWKEVSVRSICVLGDGQTFVSSYYHSTAKVWNRGEEKPVGELKGHLAEISALFCTSDGKYVITGSDDYSIRVWNPAASFELVATLTGHLNEVKILKASCDDKLLFSGSPDDMLIIWSLESLREVARYQAPGIQLLVTSPDSQYCASVLNSFSIHCFQLARKVSCLRPTLQFPFSEELSVPGTNSFFGASISQLHQGKTVNSLAAAGPVSPYFFNALHVCAYNNHSNSLNDFLKAGVPIVRGAFGSFLTVALERNTRKCLDMGLQYLTSLCLENKGWAAVQEITADLPRLISTNSLLLSAFLQAIFRPSQQTDLKNFIYPKTTPPLIVLNPNWYVSMSNYESSTSDLQHEEVEVLVSDFSWNWALGSRESMKLLTALEGCLDRKVLTTPLITTVITWKWNQLMPITLALTVVYSSLLVAMICLIFDYGPLEWIKNTFLVLNVFLLLYEGTQSLVNGYEYWQDPWNYLDWVRSALCLLWVYFFKGYQYVELCVVCMCFLRGFTYFRTFKMTRMYVRLTLEVVKEMYSFLIVFAYAIIAFGMMYAVLVPLQVHSAFEAWMTAYELLMGSYTTEGYQAMQWLCFTSASLVNVIIMLNLLISILGDAYEHTHTYAKENDTLEMLRIVIEYESMLFWRRNAGQQMVPTLCRVAGGQGVTEEWEGKINQITKRIKEELNQNEQYMTARSTQVMIAVDSLDSQVKTVSSAVQRVHTKAAVSDKSAKALIHLLEDSNSSLDNRLIFAEASLSRLHSKVDLLVQTIISKSNPSISSL